MKTKATLLLVLALLISALPVAADDTQIMFSRYDGAPISVKSGEEAQYAADYAGMEEMVTLYSRADGEAFEEYAFGIQFEQEGFATQRQNILMYSKYDGAAVVVHAWEAASMRGSYWGEKTVVTLYSRYDGATVRVWAPEVRACLESGYTLSAPSWMVPQKRDGGYPGFEDVPTYAHAVGRSVPEENTGSGPRQEYCYSETTFVEFLQYVDTLDQWGYWLVGETVFGRSVFFNGSHYLTVSWDATTVDKEKPTVSVHLMFWQP